jgi:hypothetical protein
MPLARRRRSSGNQKARERFLAATDRALTALIELAMNAKNDMVGLRAASDILDRAGIGIKAPDELDQ